MDNKTEYFTLNHSGLILWIENMPEVVNFVEQDGEFFKSSYDHDLQSAISNAKEVSNQREVENQIRIDHRIYFPDMLKVGTPYPLQCHVEKKEFCEDFDKEGRPFDCPFNGSERHKTVALVTFSEPEEIRPCEEWQNREPSAGVEETQEELWDDAIAITGVYYPSTFGRFKVIEELSKAFTITRKNK